MRNCAFELKRRKKKKKKKEGTLWRRHWFEWWIDFFFFFSFFFFLFFLFFIIFYYFFFFFSLLAANKKAFHTWQDQWKGRHARALLPRLFAGKKRKESELKIIEEVFVVCLGAKIIEVLWFEFKLTSPNPNADPNRRNMNPFPRTLHMNDEWSTWKRLFNYWPQNRKTSHRNSRLHSSPKTSSEHMFSTVLQISLMKWSTNSVEGLCPVNFDRQQRPLNSVKRA